jgi:hypothetical protein
MNADSFVEIRSSKHKQGSFESRNNGMGSSGMTAEQSLPFELSQQFSMEDGRSSKAQQNL